IGDPPDHLELPMAVTLGVSLEVDHPPDLRLTGQSVPMAPGGRRMTHGYRVEGARPLTEHTGTGYWVLGGENSELRTQNSELMTHDPISRRSSASWHNFLCSW